MFIVKLIFTKLLFFSFCIWEMMMNFIQLINKEIAFLYLFSFSIFIDKVRVKLQLWDTAGQERFRSITRSYYRNCAGCLVVYDITNRDSFDHVREWLEEAKYATEDQDIVYCLIGHKVDLDYQREVSTSEGEAFAHDHGMMFIETSAKVFCNVEESFQGVAREIYNRLECGNITQKEGWDGVKTVPFRPGNIYLSQETLNEVNGKSDRKCCR